MLRMTWRVVSSPRVPGSDLVSGARVYTDAITLNGQSLHNAETTGSKPLPSPPPVDQLFVPRSHLHAVKNRPATAATNACIFKQVYRATNAAAATENELAKCFACTLALGDIICIHHGT